MGLIVGKSIKKLQKGFPTIAGKNTVRGGILETGSVAFGQAMTYGTVAGYYKAAAAIESVYDLAGIVQGTNVKLVNVWPANNATVETSAGESFNLLLNGYIAVELDSTAVNADVVEGATVYINLTTGKFTTESDEAGTALLGSYFTGIKETVAEKVVAEIYFTKPAATLDTNE